MADKTKLNITLLLRRADFEDSCVLAAGEPGYHTTTKEFKIGDGTTTWSALPIANKKQIDNILLGYKTKQTAKSDPIANGSSLSFIDSITQDANGVITATKKLVDLDAYVKTEDLPEIDVPTADDFGVLTLSKQANTAIEVSNASAQHPSIGFKLDNSGNVELSQSNSGLKANIDLSGYELTDTTYTFANGTTEGTFRVKAEGASNYTTITIGGDKASKVKSDLIGASGDAEGTSTIYGAKAYADARKEEVVGMLNNLAAVGLTREIVTALPAIANAEKNKMYLVKRSAGTESQDVYDEYLVVEVNGVKQYELLGNTELDLSNYYTKTQVNNGFKSKQTAVADPTASGSSMTFIDTISQNANGVISVTKKTVNAYTQTESDGKYKPKQTAKSSPSASGSTTAFIDSISQDINGVITATKKNIDFSAYETKATAEGKYKPKQTAKNSPSASGSTTAFIDSITQDANGVITATKKNVDFTALTNHVNSDHVTKVSAGTDIVVTPASGTGAVTVSHKAYGTGTIMDVNHNSETDPSFVTGIVVENGHVTNATVQNLKTVLQTDAFKELFFSLLSDNVVIDGGTEADTVTLKIL